MFVDLGKLNLKNFGTNFLEVIDDAIRKKVTVKFCCQFPFDLWEHVKFQLLNFLLLFPLSTPQKSLRIKFEQKWA